MSSGLARLEPAFYTNHTLIHDHVNPSYFQTLDPIPAALETTYRKDLVEDVSRYMVSIERLVLSTRALPIIDNRNGDFWIERHTTRIYLPLALYSMSQLVDWLNSPHGDDVATHNLFNTYRWSLDGDGNLYADYISFSSSLYHYGVAPTYHVTALTQQHQQGLAALFPYTLSPALARLVDMPTYVMVYPRDPLVVTAYNIAYATDGLLFDHTEGAPAALHNTAVPLLNYIYYHPELPTGVWRSYGRVQSQSSVVDKSTTKNILVTTSLPCVGELFQNEQSRFVLGEFAPPSTTYTSTMFADASNYTDVNAFEYFNHAIYTLPANPAQRHNPPLLSLASVPPQTLVYNAGASRRWVDITSAVPLRKLQFRIQYQTLFEANDVAHSVLLQPGDHVSLKLAWYRKT